MILQVVNVLLFPFEQNGICRIAVHFVFLHKKCIRQDTQIGLFIRRVLQFEYECTSWATLDAPFPTCFSILQVTPVTEFGNSLGARIASPYFEILAGDVRVTVHTTEQPDTFRTRGPFFRLLGGAKRGSLGFLKAPLDQRSRKRMGSRAPASASGVRKKNNFLFFLPLSGKEFGGRGGKENEKHLCPFLGIRNSWARRLSGQKRAERESVKERCRRLYSPC